jgi:hypothetical protein
MRSVRVCGWVCLALAMPAVAVGQGRQANPEDLAREIERLRNVTERAAQAMRATPVTSDVLAGPVVTDAPFSADATTTVTQILSDGTRIEQHTTARFYRDRAGRVRREQTILGLGPLNAGGNMQTITIDPDPGDGTAYTLDPMTRTARRVPRIAAPLPGSMSWVALPGDTSWVVRSSGAAAANTVVRQGRTGGPPLGGTAGNPTEEILGTRQFEGVKALGRKTTSVIPTGQIGNDRPIEITDERWESPELRMLIYSRNSDPRTGVVEYRLTNINRSEPPADLFTIPPDYTVNQPPPPLAPGQRGRGGREGGPGTTGR